MTLHLQSSVFGCRWQGRTNYLLRFTFYIFKVLRFDVEFQVAECKVVERYLVKNQVVEQSYCRTYKSSSSSMDPHPGEAWVERLGLIMGELISCRSIKFSNINFVECGCKLPTVLQIVELVGLFFISDPLVLRGSLRLG
jgi:hypothetical protein